MMTTAVLLKGETPSADADTDIGACLAAALGVADDYAQHRAFYEDRFGYVRYDRAMHALTVRAYRFRGVMLYGKHADKAHEALGDRPLPIFGIGGGVRVFLTALPAPDDDVDRCEVALYGAFGTIVGANAELALPTPGNERRNWLSGLPRGIELPSYREVFTAVTGASQIDRAQHGRL